MNNFTYSNELYHHGILGMKWGIRRYQNPDGSLTEVGKKRYAVQMNKQHQKDVKELMKAYKKYNDEIDTEAIVNSKIVKSCFEPYKKEYIDSINKKEDMWDAFEEYINKRNIKTLEADINTILSKKKKNGTVDEEDLFYSNLISTATGEGRYRLIVGFADKLGTWDKCEIKRNQKNRKITEEADKAHKRIKAIEEEVANNVLKSIGGKAPTQPKKLTVRHIPSSKDRVQESRDDDFKSIIIGEIRGKYYINTINNRGDKESPK